MITNLIVAVSAGMILLDQADMIDGLSYPWLAVTLIGWGILKTSYELGMKKRQQEEVQAKAEEFVKGLIAQAQKPEDKDDIH